jgi:hypothetical protein
MTEKVETLHAAGFLVSEAEGNRSRDNIVVASGQNLGAGTVIAPLVTAGTITAAALGTNTGNGTMGTLSVGGGAKEGDYVVTIIEPATNLGNFSVTDPDGIVIGHGTVGSAFAGDVNFTLADGATDFVSGDQFKLTVSQLTRKYKILAPAATDGTQRASGILLAAIDATSADTAGVNVARDSEVNANELTWPGGITAAQKDVAIAQLRALGIMVRA